APDPGEPPPGRAPARSGSRGDPPLAPRATHGLWGGRGAQTPEPEGEAAEDLRGYTGTDGYRQPATPARGCAGRPALDRSEFRGLSGFSHRKPGRHALTAAHDPPPWLYHALGG